MPHTQSAKKRLRQGQKRHAANKATKSRLGTLRRRFDAALAEGDLDGAQAALTTAQKAYDQAGAKHVIHKNSAARKVSQMYQKLQAAKAEASA